MRILYIAGNPEGASSLELEREIQMLQAKLDAEADDRTIDLRFHSHLRIDELPELISRMSPDVLHFAAHGEEDGIVLADEDQQPVLLDGAMLADLLGALAVRPRLVVINACNSEAMAREVARSADFVVGTDSLISNSGARAMAATLYQRLAVGASIGDAFTTAATMLRVIDQGKVAAKLFPDDETAAQRSFLTDPLRMLACLPEVDGWLKRGRQTPHRSFRIASPAIQFGLAGVSACLRQAVLFTDDDTVLPRAGGSLEEARCWVDNGQPVAGELWIEPYYRYYGDMRWYAAVTTAEHAVSCCASSTIEGLERYYFTEAWRGPLPDQIAEVVRGVMAHLSGNDGARRGDRLRLKIGSVHRTR